MAGVLPVSTPVSAEFSTLFSDTSTDPTNSDPSLLMDPFHHSLTNAANNMSTEIIRDRFTSIATRGRFVYAAAIISGGTAHPYVLPEKWTPSLTSPDPRLDNKIFAYDGENIANQAHTVEIPTEVFGLLNNQVLVSTVATIQAFLQANVDNEWMGPFTADDQGIEIVKGRKIIPIPHSVVGLFLAKEGGVSPRYYFTTILPQLEAEGIADACLSLTQFFQMAITRRQANVDESFLEVVKPSSPGRIPALVKHKLELLQRHFPLLSPGAATSQQNVVAQGIGVIATQQQAHYDRLEAAKVAEKANALEKWLGKAKVKTLLRLTGMSTVAELVASNPVWQDMADTTDKHRRQMLQTAVDDLLVARDEEHLTCVVSHGMYLNCASLKWERHSEDSAKTGFLGNPYLFCNENSEEQEEAIRAVDTARSGNAALTTSDAEKVIQLIIRPPMENEGLIYLKRIELLYTVLLPANHPALIYIRKLIKALDSYSSKWKTVSTSDSSLQLAKDVLLLQNISLRLSRYWKAQSMSDSSMAALLPSANEIIECIALSTPWEPRLSQTLRRNLKITELCRIGMTAPSSSGHARDDMSVLTDSSILGQYIQHQLAAARAAGGGGGAAGGSGGGGGGNSNTGGGNSISTTVTNDSFNASIFGEYERRQVNGRPVKCREVRYKISRGELPGLPLSKIDQSPMCLAWHTKKMCNADCPRGADHVHYTDAEYEQLKSWCVANYPGNPQEGGGV